MKEEVQKGVELLQTILTKVTEFLVNYSFEVLGACLVLILGAIASKWAGAVALRFLERRKVDLTIARFSAAGVKLVILGFAIIVALGKFGITITPMVAALSAIAFGGTFALQGTLSNFAAGLSILMTRPFTVGNTITVVGVSGVVEEVKLGATILSTEDGERITIPNKHIVGEILRNSYDHHIVEAVVGISYSDDPERAMAVIRRVFEESPHVVKQPAPLVGIHDFGESSVNLGLRYWVPTRQRYQAWYATNLAMWKALKAASITMPFPQRDVHVISSSGPSSTVRSV